MRPTTSLSVILLIGTFLSACSLAPDHQTPRLELPAKYKQGGAIEGKWQLASAVAGTPDDTAWWTIFNDEKLNQLEQLAIKENNSLKAAAARLEQSRAALRQTTGGFYPRIDITGNASRADLGREAVPTSNFSFGAIASYDANTLVQIKDASTGSQANTRAAQALYRQALLMVQADVADHYYALLALDTERELLRKTIALRLEGQELIERRFKEGEAGEQDFLRAKADTTSTQAELNALDEQRAIREHALAVLVGKLPANFDVADTKLPGVLPRIPPGLPSTLLERRPDIAAAQQRMIQTNAQIGIARATFFPSISLTALGGVGASDLSDLFEWSSRSWLLGPLFGNALSLPVFDMGRRAAGVDLAKGRYAEAVSDYRQSVLVAFKDVEDSLAALNNRAKQADNLYQAAAAATKANRISNLRYTEGETSYLEVLDTQRNTLAVQRAYTQVQGGRFRATVNLIRALGGGWFKAMPQAIPETVSSPVSATPQEQMPVAEPVKAPPVKKAEPMTIAPPVVAPSKPAFVAPPKATAPVAAPKPVPAVPQPAAQRPAPTAQARDFNEIDPSILFD